MRAGAARGGRAGGGGACGGGLGGGGGVGVGGSECGVGVGVWRGRRGGDGGGVGGECGAGGPMRTPSHLAQAVDVPRPRRQHSPDAAPHVMPVQCLLLTPLVHLAHVCTEPGLDEA